VTSAIVAWFRGASNIRVANLQLAVVRCARQYESPVESVLCNILCGARWRRGVRGYWVRGRHSPERRSRRQCLESDGLMPLDSLHRLWTDLCNPRSPSGKVRSLGPSGRRNGLFHQSSLALIIPLPAIWTNILHQATLRVAGGNTLLYRLDGPR
jgi:hypothetical protein